MSFPHNFFLAAALIGRRTVVFWGAVLTCFGAALPFCLAHLAFCAADILAQAEALIVRSFCLLADERDEARVANLAHKSRDCTLDAAKFLLESCHYVFSIHLRPFSYDAGRW